MKESMSMGQIQAVGTQADHTEKGTDLVEKLLKITVSSAIEIV